ncbi:MAG: glycosyltransferase family 9 protein [Ignavibacteria bacterium]|nr:glycosyltransferase family 9 protein [Ignavibacteria bacterium]
MPVLNMNILIIALSGLGDALMFTPALAALSSKYPDANIHILTMFKATQDIYKNNPHISKIYFWNFLKENPFKSINFLLSLRNQYDISINVFPANRFPYNMISRIIGANKRLGHDYLHTNIRSLNFLNNYRILENNDLHNVEENIRLINLVTDTSSYNDNSLQLYVDQESKNFAQEWLDKENISKNSLLIGFHAGSALFKNQIHKRWDKDKYAELAEILHQNYNATVLLFGGPEEQDVNEYIAARSKAKIVKTPSLLSGLALISRCNLFVSNDSGLMHCAAALHIPTVAIFGYTSHVHTKPWSDNSIVVRRNDLPCSPCFYFSPKPAQCRQFSGNEQFKCIKEISVTTVLNACKQLLDTKKDI